jgi:hypothetical protein
MPKKPAISPSAAAPNEPPTAAARHTVLPHDLSAGYAAIAADEAREIEATAWAESLVADVADKPTCRN